MKRNISIVRIQVIVSVLLLLVCLWGKRYLPTEFQDLKQQYMEYIFDDTFTAQEPVRFVLSGAVESQDCEETGRK